MRPLYIVTNNSDCSHVKYYGDVQWGEGITNKAACGPGDSFTASDWYTAYYDIRLAVMLNNYELDISRKRHIWYAHGNGGIKDEYGIRCRVEELTTFHRMGWPFITPEQAVEFAIRCAKSVHRADLDWFEWADRWLSGVDRTTDFTPSRQRIDTRSFPEGCAVSAARDAAMAASYNMVGWEKCKWAAFAIENAAMADQGLPYMPPLDFEDLLGQVFTSPVLEQQRAEVRKLVSPAIDFDECRGYEKRNRIPWHMRSEFYLPIYSEDYGWGGGYPEGKVAIHFLLEAPKTWPAYAAKQTKITVSGYDDYFMEKYFPDRKSLEAFVKQQSWTSEFVSMDNLDALGFTAG